MTFKFSDFFTAKILLFLLIHENSCKPQNCVFNGQSYFSARFIFDGLAGAFCGTIQQKGSTGKSAVQQYAKAT